MTLSGTAREIDKRRGRVIFDSGFDEPFSIVAGGSQGRNSFVLQWRLLPEFQIDGRIRVWADDHRDEDRLQAATMASSLRRPACSA